MTVDRCLVSRDIGDSRWHVESSSGRSPHHQQTALRHRSGSRIRISPGNMSIDSLKRYREGGLDALEPGPGGRRATRTQTSPEVRERIIELRQSLTSQGLDDGPVTIAWHLEQDGLPVPSTSTIRRILHAGRPDHPEPRKTTQELLSPVRSRPTQRDLAVRLHPLAPRRRHRRGDPELARRPLPLPALLHRPRPRHRRRRHRDVPAEHRNLRRPRLDPHRQRLRLHRPLHRRQERRSNTSSPTSAPARRTATPATRKPRARSNASIKPRNAGSPPNHRATTLTELQHQLDHFRTVYNEQRPHRALERHTPGTTYRATPKATVPSPAPPRPLPAALRPHRHHRQNELPPRRPHAPPRHRRRSTPANASSPSPTTPPSPIIDLNTGEILSTHRIEPDRQYWRNQQKSPGRWPGAKSVTSCRDSDVSYVATHHTVRPKGFEPPTF